jgi:hypothetical protein
MSRVAVFSPTVLPLLLLLLLLLLHAQEVKSGDAVRVRSLLARMTSLPLPPKKMKGFFRWVWVNVCAGVPDVMPWTMVGAC